MVAALNGHGGCVEALIEANAELHSFHPIFRMSALHWACHNAHLLCVELLVNAGCDVDTKTDDPEGLSGVELAKENVSYHCLRTHE